MSKPETTDARPPEGRWLVWARPLSDDADQTFTWWTAWYEDGYWLTGVDVLEQTGVLTEVTHRMPLPESPDGQ